MGGNSYIANFNAEHSNIDWILDTGATHHMCFFLYWFIMHNELTPIMVNLFDENSIATYLCRGINGMII